MQDLSIALLHFLLVLFKVLEGSTTVVLQFVLSTGVDVVAACFWCQIPGLAMLFVAAGAIEGKDKLPWKRMEVMVRVFVIGLLSSASQLMLIQALVYTSPTFVAVMGCLIPIFSSVIAILFKVEILHYWRVDGQAKILGVILACSGATITSTYRGAHLLNSNISNGSLHYVGVGLSFLACILIGVLVNIQLPLYRRYQAPWSVLCGANVTVTIILGSINFLLLKNWSIPPIAASIGILYTGTIGIIAMGGLAWILTRTNLFLVCCYASLQPIATIVLSAIFLKSTIYFGSIIGAIVVLSGVIISGWADAETQRLAKVEAVEELLVDNRNSTR